MPVPCLVMEDDMVVHASPAMHLWLHDIQLCEACMLVQIQLDSVAEAAHSLRCSRVDEARFCSTGMSYTEVFMGGLLCSAGSVPGGPPGHGPPGTHQERRHHATRVVLFRQPQPLRPQQHLLLKSSRMPPISTALLCPSSAGAVPCLYHRERLCVRPCLKQCSALIAGRMIGGCSRRGKPSAILHWILHLAACMARSPAVAVS